jgi:hypothetical protein
VSVLVSDPPVAGGLARRPYQTALFSAASAPTLESSMPLDSIQKVLSIASSCALIGGVIIALVQLGAQQRVKQMDVVMRLYQSFGEEGFVRHFSRVSSWKYKTYSEFKEQSTPDDFVSLMVVSVFFENMGLLLRRKYASIELLDDLLSGPVLDTWPKVSPVWAGLRGEFHHPAWAEWFEYFHDAMADRMAKLA